MGQLDNVGPPSTNLVAELQREGQQYFYKLCKITGTSPKSKKE